MRQVSAKPDKPRSKEWTVCTEAKQQPRKNESEGTRLATQSQMPDPFMHAAIEEALRGEAEGGIPIGSVLVRDGKIIGRGHNQRVQKLSPTLHAEIDCIENAGRQPTYRDTVLYSTLMPCFLCAGAAVQFGITKIVVGESRTFTGAKEWLRERGVQVIDLDLEECARMMDNFIRRHPALWNEDIGEE
jgi:cytosine/creatinine deaminase